LAWIRCLGMWTWPRDWFWRGEDGGLDLVTGSGVAKLAAVGEGGCKGVQTLGCCGEDTTDRNCVLHTLGKENCCMIWSVSKVQ
jgi:hypothetical protein